MNTNYLVTAELLMLLGGAAAFLLTLYWVRSRDLREKYAVVWMLMATVLLLAGIFPDAIKALAQLARLSYPAAILFLALTVIYLFSFSVSISLTRQYRRALRLTQTVGLLEQRVRELEERARRETVGSEWEGER